MGAPPFLSATLYMTLARIISALDAATFSLVSPRWLTTIYVIVDVFAFLSQIAGVGLQASPSTSVTHVGKAIVLAGLLFQAVAMCFFLLIGWRLQHCVEQSPSTISIRLRGWKKHMFALHTVGIAILVRNLVRVIEYAQGSRGFVATHEVMVYMFDAVPILLAMVVYAVVHPGRLLRAPRELKENQMENSEAELKMLDPEQEHGILLCRETFDVGCRR